MNMLNTFIQALQATGVDFKSIFEVVSYIITGVIGGVLYKFVQLWSTHKTTETSHTAKATGNLITQLEDRIKSLTDRVIELEERREQSYVREMELTMMLAKAEQKVEMLEAKVLLLENNHELIEHTVNKYYEKYGALPAG